MPIAPLTTSLAQASTRQAPPPAVRIGLLGLGHVGSAVARLARAPLGGDAAVEVTGALVRDPTRRRDAPGVAITTEPMAIFAARPTVIVEALGGLEPARTIVLEAIRRRLPVVSANKSLLAHHGDEIFAAAATAGVPVLFEASVLAGVPFLGTFARRPYGAAASRLTGILNGTTNFVLSRLQDGMQYDAALALAQQCGFAEPDPSKDIDGIDAAEKLAILLRIFGRRRVQPSCIETTGIAGVSPDDLRAAQALGGTLKPVVHADGLDPDAPAISAFAGPAFVPDSHVLAHVHQQTNGLCLEDVRGSQLTFTGPGAGPDITAVTVLDDAIEAATAPPARVQEVLDARPAPAVTGWFVRVTAVGGVPARAHLTDVFAAQGVTIERMTLSDELGGAPSTACLTRPCTRHEVERAGAALGAATGARLRALRAIPNP